MKVIQESTNEHKWPRKQYKQVGCRKRDLVVRIANWLDDKDEPSFDVEVYIGGVYDWNESQVFSVHDYITASKAKLAAVKFAGEQINKLL